MSEEDSTNVVAARIQQTVVYQGGVLLVRRMFTLVSSRPAQEAVKAPQPTQSYALQVGIAIAS